MTTKSQTQTYPNVRVTFRAATDHGQLQKVADLVADQTAVSVKRAS
ncbi:hypothetical protein [Ornithinimicrobium cavernae]|nr:hypothetical protein [Ornithinimicrobium cavernae]